MSSVIAIVVGVVASCCSRCCCWLCWWCWWWWWRAEDWAFSLLVSERLAWRSSCLRSFRSFRWSSRFKISSLERGSPEQVCGCELCAGRPGPFLVFSFLRHFARLFWNQTYIAAAGGCNEMFQKRSLCVRSYVMIVLCVLSRFGQIDNDNNNNYNRTITIVPRRRSQRTMAYRAAGIYWAHVRRRRRRRCRGGLRAPGEAYSGRAELEEEEETRLYVIVSSQKGKGPL